MEFIVKRASDIFAENKPCEEAYQKEIEDIQEYYLNAFEEYDAKWGKFTNTGINHRVNERGNIEREVPEYMEDMWIVNINTLEELLDFKEKYGKVVIGESNKNYHYNQITIYDHWLE